MVILSEYRLNKLWKIENQLPHFRVHLDTVKNWKHGSKIIFKCVNNTVELIFNEKVAEK